MANLIAAFSFTEFMGNVWDALTSKIALIVYAAIILVLILVLVIRVIVNEHKRVSEIAESDARRQEVHENEQLETVRAELDRKMNKISLDVAAVRKSVAYAPYGAPASALPAKRAGEKTEGTEEVNEGGSRFYMLTEIDKEYENYVRPDYDDEIELKELCEEFRNFSAGKLKLYYDIEDIRRFIGALAVTKLIILQGMSGTGKTSLAYAFGEFLENKTVVVPIQPMWKERTDLVGYYNEFTKRFNETTLLYKMYEANNNEEIYVTVLDEMNIARVEYYFAEFLSLLEIPNPDGRNLDVVADRWEDDPKLLQHNGKLRLPTNMWFVGTANNDDSTFSISDKVYDRAMVLNLDKKATPFEAEGNYRKISATHLEELMTKAQREYDISDRNLRRIKKLDEYMIKTFHITFGNRIMKQIRCYVPVLVACGGTELEALDDILARKVFRKLESKNPVHVKQMADGVCAYLDELFGEDKLPLCKETIRLIEQNV
ncbi:MAG: AAA family ATPase [Clostridia bacterium]|nr:AAA family ATPase [Clostridia bacterium]